MNVKVKLVNKHKSATADLWQYSGHNQQATRKQVTGVHAGRPVCKGILMRFTLSSVLLLSML